MRCAYVCVSIYLQSWTLPQRLPNEYTIASALLVTYMVQHSLASRPLSRTAIIPRLSLLDYRQPAALTLCDSLPCTASSQCCAGSLDSAPHRRLFLSLPHSCLHAFRLELLSSLTQRFPFFSCFQPCSAHYRVRSSSLSLSASVPQSLGALSSYLLATTRPTIRPGATRRDSRRSSCGQEAEVLSDSSTRSLPRSTRFIRARCLPVKPGGRQSGRWQRGGIGIG